MLHHNACDECRYLPQGLTGRLVEVGTSPYHMKGVQISAFKALSDISTPTVCRIKAQSHKRPLFYILLRSRYGACIAKPRVSRTHQLAAGLDVRKLQEAEQTAITQTCFASPWRLPNGCTVPCSPRLNPRLNHTRLE